MIALTRLVLAGSGLLILFFVPPENGGEAPQTYIALGVYTAYSAAVYLLEQSGSRLRDIVSDWGHWIDVACYTALITLSSGANSIFFFGYFLPILVASFRYGFAAGIRVTVVSTLLFATLGLATAPGEPAFKGQVFVIRPVYLLTLGYMIAYWGGAETKLKQRLALLREVGTISNPRFGVDRTLGTIMYRLMQFFHADGCALITVDPLTKQASLRRATRGDSENTTRAEPLPQGIAELLLSPGADQSLIYSAPSAAGWPWTAAVCRTVEAAPSSGANGALQDMDERERSTSPGNGTQRREDPENTRPTCDAIAAALDSPSFVTVPLSFRNRMSGRLYLTVSGRRVFDESEARFLQQAVGHALPIVDNIRLVNQLASAAAEEERRRIARDIHDSVIQPYLGLHIGLAGMRQKLSATHSELCGDVERLMELTNIGIDDLRRQVAMLKAGGEQEGSLLPAVWRFASKFSEVTGIAVHVEAEAEVRVEDRLAAEAFQMVAEGLSNIRRHTRASHATVGLSCRDGSLHLRIENDGAEEPCAAFTPRSITERAAALGGAARVLSSAVGSTVVSIEVPL